MKHLKLVFQNIKGREKKAIFYVKTVRCCHNKIWHFISNLVTQLFFPQETEILILC